MGLLFSPGHLPAHPEKSSPPVGIGPEWQLPELSSKGFSLDTVTRISADMNNITAVKGNWDPCCLPAACSRARTKLARVSASPLLAFPAVSPCQRQKALLHPCFSPAVVFSPSRFLFLFPLFGFFYK